MKNAPRWLKPYYLDSDQIRFTSLIQSVESKTQAELVPLIVRSSIDLKLWGWLCFWAATTFVLAFPPLTFELLPWDLHLSLNTIYILWALIIYPLTFFLFKSPFFVKLIFTKPYLESLMNRRATSEFFFNKLDKTESRTAILFMYSVLERKAVIFADPNLIPLPQSLWEQAVSHMITGAKNQSFYAGFELALQTVAQALSEHYPPKNINNNEIADRVIIKE